MQRKSLYIAFSAATLVFAPLAYSPAVLAQAAAVQPKEGWYKAENHPQWDQAAQRGPMVEFDQRIAW